MATKPFAYFPLIADIAFMNIIKLLFTFFFLWTLPTHAQDQPSNPKLPSTSGRPSNSCSLTDDKLCGLQAAVATIYSGAGGEKEKGPSEQQTVLKFNCLKNGIQTPCAPEVISIYESKSGALIAEGTTPEIILPIKEGTRLKFKRHKNNVVSTLSLIRPGQTLAVDLND